MLTLCGEQHSFSTHGRMFFWKCQCFWGRKPRPEGDSNPNLRIHVDCSNHLRYQGQTFAVPYFWHWLWRYRYFWSKINIENDNCAQATAFIFDTGTDVLAKVSKFLDRKRLDLRRARTPNLRINVECSNHLSYQIQLTSAVGLMLTTDALRCIQRWLCHGYESWNDWVIHCSVRQVKKTKVCCRSLFTRGDSEARIQKKRLSKMIKWSMAYQMNNTKNNV